MKKLLLLALSLTTLISECRKGMNLYDAEIIIKDVNPLNEVSFDMILDFLAAVRYCEKNASVKAISLNGLTTTTCTEIAEVIKANAKKKNLTLRSLFGHPEQGPTETRIRMADSYAKIKSHYLQ